MFSSIFKRKGIYIALLIISLLILAGTAAFVLLTPAGFSFPAEFGDFGGSEDGAQFPAMPEGFGGGEDGAQFPAMPEGFGGGEDGMQFPSMPEGFGSGEDGAQFPAMPEGFQPPTDMGQAQDFSPGAMGRVNILLIVGALALLTAIFSVIMLIRLSRRKKRQSLEAAEAEDDFISHKKKSGTGPYILVLALLSALFIALLPEPTTDESAQINKQLIEATAERGSISRSLVAAGSIAEGSTKAVSLAGSIKVEHWYVNPGDYVQQGQVIAQLDKDSVILAIAELTELMAQIDADINTSLNDVIENAIYAPAAGRIKSIYASPGVAVQDTVAEHSALMRLSLDGLMAADIQVGEAVQSGMAVTAQLSDGSVIDGNVESVFEGVACVVMSDEKAAYGEPVSIYDAQGSLLGTAELYIHREVKISGIAGTVQRLNVEENMLVGTDMALVVLTDTAYRGQRDILTEQRREMEEELTKLFEAYNSGQIVSPCDGRVAALNEDILIEKLSMTEPPEQNTKPSMESYAVTVKALENGVFTLSYSDGLSQRELQMDLSGAVIFKYVDGSYLPAVTTDIAVGDSLVLSCYVSGGSTVLDHVVLFAAGKQEFPGGQGTQGGGMSGGGMSGGGMSGGGMSGGGMSGGGMSGSSAQYGSAQSGTDSAEDTYSMSKTILCYVNPYDEAEITITVDELDISRYSVGHSLTVNLDALPGQSFAGTVTCIDPNGENDGGSTKYSVTVSIPRSENMLSGMNASVRLEAESRQDVLTVPLAAVYEEDGKVFIYTDYDAESGSLGGAVEVETGLSDGERVEIVSGLSEGDKYFYSYADTIEYNFQ